MARPLPCREGCLQGVPSLRVLPDQGQHSGSALGHGTESQPHSELTSARVQSLGTRPTCSACSVPTAQTRRSGGEALSCPGGAGNVISSAPVSASFSRLAPGSQAPSLWPRPEAAVAFCVPLSCHGPRAVPGVRPGQPLCPDAVSFSLIWNSGLHAGPPVHLSLKRQGHVTGLLHVNAH